MIDVRAREATTTEGASCPLCREALTDAPDVGCRGCDTSYHSACLAELGGCSTLGCALRGVPVGIASTLGCAVCGRLAAVERSRRRCGCGAVLHGPCVDAHAVACERGRHLLGQAAWEPLRTRNTETMEYPLGGAVVGALVAQGFMGLVASWGLGPVLTFPEVRFGATLLSLFAAGFVLGLVARPTLARCVGARRKLAGAVALLTLLVPAFGLIAWGALLVHVSRVPAPLDDA